MMSTIDTLKLALEALEQLRTPLRVNTSLDAYDVGRAIAALREALASEAKEQPAQQEQEPVAWWIPKAEQFCLPSSDGTRPFAKAWEPLYTHPQPDAYGYAKRLAEAIWKKHYQSTAPQWEPFDDLMGVLTQIDNMTSGLITPPNVATPLDETAYLAAQDLQTELAATNRQVEILSDALAESRREVAALKAVQEPVAWVEKNGDFVWQNYEAAIGRNLYTTPPAAPVQEFVCSTGLCHYKANKENT